MTKVIIDKAVIEQAIDALNMGLRFRETGLGRPPEQYNPPAIKALRAALERPSVEPVYWGQPDACGNIVDGIPTNDKETGHEGWTDEYNIPLYKSFD